MNQTRHDYGNEFVTCQQKIGSFFVTIEERLKEERLRLGYTQPDFAALAGKTKKTMIDYEKGVTSPDAKFLAAIAAAGADVQYILTGERFLADAPARLPAEEAQLLAWLRGLNEAARTGLMLFAANAAASPKGSLIGQQFNGSVGQAVQGDIYHGPRRRRGE